MPLFYLVGTEPGPAYSYDLNPDPERYVEWSNHPAKSVKKAAAPESEVAE